MAWRDQLQKGSFRGAPFYWQKSDGELGRKTARHDYPLRDEAYIEDLGKAPREFTLDVLVIGPNYMAARDLLIAALETPGPGTLVHPTFGTMQVSLNGKVRLSESTAEGGMARFTLPFVVAAANKQPVASVDTSGAVATRATAARGLVRDNFGRNFILAGKPAFVAAAAETLTQRALARIRALAALIPTGPATPAWLVDAHLIGLAVSDLIRKPFDLADKITGLIAGLDTLTDDPLALIGIHRGLFSFGDDLKPVARTTANRRRQADNQQALVNLVRQTAVIEAAVAAAVADYPSHQDAVTVRDELADRLDREMEAATDDATYQALADLRAATVRDITVRGADLARIVSYTPARTLPALVVAHALYGDAALADEIVARNKIRHPGFIPGGNPLEVLTNA